MFQILIPEISPDSLDRNSILKCAIEWRKTLISSLRLVHGMNYSEAWILGVGSILGHPCFSSTPNGISGILLKNLCCGKTSNHNMELRSWVTSYTLVSGLFLCWYIKSKFFWVRWANSWTTCSYFTFYPFTSLHQELNYNKSTYLT